MARGALPQNDGKCETPIDKNKELAERLARGTPAVYPPTAGSSRA
jgi:hypothetical protein